MSAGSTIGNPKAIDADWSDFREMSPLQLKEEYMYLMDEDPCSDRLRRLSMFIALRWVAGELE